MKMINFKEVDSFRLRTEKCLVIEKWPYWIQRKICNNKKHLKWTKKVKKIFVTITTTQK